MRVPTEKQREASRENGRKSTGRPRKLTGSSALLVELHGEWELEASALR